MPFFHLPKFMYESMPTVYVVAGGSAAFWSENLLGVASGLALVVAGLHIRVLRKRYRQAHTQRLAKIDARLRRSRAPKDFGTLS